MSNKDKLKGQRLGQLVHNAISSSLEDATDEDVGYRLFYIPDKDLTKLINEYLESL